MSGRGRVSKRPRYTDDQLEAFCRGLDTQLFLVAAILATTQTHILNFDEAVDDAMELRNTVLLQMSAETIQES